MKLDVAITFKDGVLWIVGEADSVTLPNSINDMWIIKKGNVTYYYPNSMVSKCKTTEVYSES